MFVQTNASQMSNHGVDGGQISCLQTLKAQSLYGSDVLAMYNWPISLLYFIIHNKEENLNFYGSTLQSIAIHTKM